MLSASIVRFGNLSGLKLTVMEETLVCLPVCVLPVIISYKKVRYSYYYSALSTQHSALLTAVFVHHRFHCRDEYVGYRVYDQPYAANGVWHIKYRLGQCDWPGVALFDIGLFSGGAVG